MFGLPLLHWLWLFSKLLYSLDFYFIITIVAAALLLLTFYPDLTQTPYPTIILVFNSKIHIFVYTCMYIYAIRVSEKVETVKVM